MITSSSSSLAKKEKKDNHKKTTLDGARIKACHNLFVSDPKNKGGGKRCLNHKESF